MDCYNVKVIDYVNSSEVRIYSNLIGKKELVKSLYDVSNNSNDTENINNIHIINSKQIDIDTYLDDKKIKEKDRVKALERSLYSSKNRTVNSIYEIARSNSWEYFLTLTFNPDKVDSYDYDLVTKKLSQWINNFKKKYAPNLKYILVPELHKSGRYHFHGLLTDIGSADLVDSGKRDKGNIIYNLGNYKLGYSTITLISDTNRASSYISKYITKDLCASSFGKKRYWASKNLQEPKVTTYVMTQEEINDMIDSFTNRISHSKTVECVNYDMKTTYYELS